MTLLIRCGLGGAALFAQIALARRISPQQQSNEMAFASLLCTDLAMTLSALKRGAITEYAAKKVASELVVLDVHDRRAVDTILRRC